MAVDKSTSEEPTEMWYKYKKESEISKLDLKRDWYWAKNFRREIPHVLKNVLESTR